MHPSLQNKMTNATYVKLSFPRWQPIDKTLHYDFSATEMFFKNRHNCLSEGLTFFPAMGSTRSEMKHSPRLRVNRQTDRHTHTHTHTHKLIAITLRLR